MTRASQHKGGLARQADAYGVANDEVGEIKHCPHCHLPLIVDRPFTASDGLGCLNCNKWGRPGDSNLVIELSDEDLEALRLLR